MYPDGTDNNNSNNDNNMSSRSAGDNSNTRLESTLSLSAVLCYKLQF